MPIDTTTAFAVILYCICLESLLFFAVVMQTKTLEPGAHPAIARYFGLIFLCQSLSSLTSALSEQFVSIAFILSSLSLLLAFTASTLAIPASVAIAFPSNPPPRAMYVGILITIWVISFTVAGYVPVLPDIPLGPVPERVAKGVLLACAGAVFVVSVAAGVRVCRKIKGRNGAFILLAAVVLLVSSAGVWTWLEPQCRQVIIDPSSNTQDSQVVNVLQLVEPKLKIEKMMKQLEIPESCPLPFKAFDHNFAFGVAVIATNVLMAEGVLRLMAAGSGVEGYVEIIPVIVT